MEMNELNAKPLDENLNGDKGLFNLHVYNNRHPSTRHMMKMLDPNPNLPDNLRDIAEEIGMLGHSMVYSIADSPELTTGLRKLLEAKDSFVRAALDTEPVDYRDR